MGSFEEYMGMTKLGKIRDDDELTHFFWNIILISTI